MNKTTPKEFPITYHQNSLYIIVEKSYSFKFFKGCLPQILLGPFLNTLSHLVLFQKSMMEPLYKNSKRLKAINNFCKKAPF